VAWWSRRIEQRLRALKRAQRAHRVTQSPRSLGRLEQARQVFKREIKGSKTRALRNAVEKVQLGVEPLDTLKRKKQAGSHQRLTTRDGDRQSFHGHWVGVFADPHPLPPPPPPPRSVTSLPASDPEPPLRDPPDQVPSAAAEPDPPGLWYSRLQAALRQVSASLFTEADVKAAVKSLQNKAPGEDGVPVSVFRGQYKAAEDLAPDDDPGVRRKEVEQAVDLYADTLADAFNHATHVGLPDWTKHGTARWLCKGKAGKDNPTTTVSSSCSPPW
jgi:hypothetical protein